MVTNTVVWRKMNRVFLSMWGYHTDKRDCFKCHIDEFTEARNWTKRDIRAIDSLGIGETYEDPDPCLKSLPQKKRSYVCVKRLK